MPMTLVNPDYCREIIGKFIDGGIELYHFSLCASRETLLKRLSVRGEGKDSWAAHQIDRCITGLDHEVFKQHLDTNDRTTGEIIEIIAQKLHINLLPSEE
ncbi:hypothetical protein MHB56_08390 [Paenibacillus sp. FSL H8-0315]|uniref:hypothetical protein n=1 Tax=Paenibacillus sp. FSL H8-0315 TaxID=2921384 RepID=UPI0030F4E59E